MFGTKVVNQLQKLGIYTMQDLLFHLPERYENRTQLTAICNVRANKSVCIQGRIQHLTHSKIPGSSCQCLIDDGTGVVNLRFFRSYPSQQHLFKPGRRLRCFGKVRVWRGQLEMAHPDYQLIDDEQAPLPTALTPVYPTTKGLTQKRLRELMLQALNRLSQANSELVDYLPAEILQRLKLPELITALHYIHQPPADAPLQHLHAGSHPAQQRLAFEELLAQHLSLRHRLQKIKQQEAPVFFNRQLLTTALLAALPFQLTSAQQHVFKEIQHDLQQAAPMFRLLQGEVGSGKTVVAALAALQAVENNYQAVLMVPTELLARQHFENFCLWFQPLGVEVVYLAGKQKNKTQAEILTKIKDGRAQVIVGTHALFQKQVHFFKLGLIIIDEQHRFGVHQRLALREKSLDHRLYPHQLIMTATPIPRTLAMTAYADLDISIIDTLPPNRLPVQTLIVSAKRRCSVMERIQKACREGQQVYWVCPLIDESEKLICQAAQTTLQQLTEALPDLRIGLVHGRLAAEEKESVMGAFKKGGIDVLVATTVVEVGVDVLNATWIVIENPERLGLAQLHQLRGRVGRGHQQSYCVLLYHQLSQLSKTRLSILRHTDDGLTLAERDLELRGSGEFLGTRQSGIIRLRIADLYRDRHYFPKIKVIADIILSKHPSIIEPLIQRWVKQEEKLAEA